MRRWPDWRIATLLAASTCSIARAQNSVNGFSFALQSSGIVTGGTNWTLGSNGYVGTYINVANAGTVTLSLSASGLSDAGVAPHMDIAVNDTIVPFDVVAGTNTYSSSMNLPAGTHFIRTQFTNASANRKLTIANLQVSGATVNNNSTNANALAAANTYINNYRKGQASITVTGLGNIPLLAGTTVKVDMVRNAFNFGGTVSGSSLNDSKDMLLTNPANGTEANQFQQFINAYYNTIVPSNAGKWSNNEPTQNNLTMQLVDRQLSYAKSHNMRARMHNVIWGNGVTSGSQQPGWVNSLISSAAGGNAADKKLLRDAIGSRLNYYVGTNGNRSQNYIELDVLNEAMHNPSYWNIYNPTTAGASTLSIASIYNDAKTAANNAGNPNLRLYLNEYNVLQFSPNSLSSGAESGSDQYANWYRNQVEAVRNAGGAVSGVGVQEYVDLSQTGSNAHSAATFQKAMQNLSVTGLPLSMAEFGFSGGASTQAIAQTAGPQAMDDAVRMFFGNPNATTFMNWGWWDLAANSAAPMKMITTTPGASTYTLTPLGQKWVDLMNAFSTHSSAVVDATGAISFSGFYGDYNIGAQGVYSNLSLAKGTSGYSVAMSAPPLWSIWRAGNSGAWGTAANWQSGGVANSAGQTAYFGFFASPPAIFVDGAKTVGMLAFDSSGQYTLSGGSITLSGLAGQAAIYLAAGSHQINAPLYLSNDTTVSTIAASQTLTLTNLKPSSVQITKAGAGAMVVNNIRSAGLNVKEGAVRVTANGASSSTSRMQALTLAGQTDAWTAKLDLADNFLVIDYPGASPLATIQNQIKSGAASGWTGNGITSASAAAVAADGSNLHKTALGFAEASAVQLGNFGVENIVGDALLVRYTLAGDANLDGLVNALDFNALAAHFGDASGTWVGGDFNYDGSVSTSDFDAISTNFNSVLPGPALGSVVPEPSACLLLIAAMLPARRGRRRCGCSAQSDRS